MTTHNLTDGEEPVPICLFQERSTTIASYSDRGLPDAARFGALVDRDARGLMRPSGAA